MEAHGGPRSAEPQSMIGTYSEELIPGIQGGGGEISGGNGVNGVNGEYSG